MSRPHRRLFAYTATGYLAKLESKGALDSAIDLSSTAYFACLP